MERQIDAVFTKMIQAYKDSPVIEEKTIRPIKMVIVPESKDSMANQIEHTSESRMLLQFVGGPTGFESYYLDDEFIEGREALVAANPEALFCICGGTVNSWPCCEVSACAMLDFLHDWQKTYQL